MNKLLLSDIPYLDEHLRPQTPEVTWRSFIWLIIKYITYKLLLWSPFYT